MSFMLKNQNAHDTCRTTIGHSTSCYPYGGAVGILGQILCFKY